MIYLAIKIKKMPSKNKKSRNFERIPRILIYSLKILALVSPSLLVKCLAKLFTTPMKHKMPKREYYMNKNSRQQVLRIPSLSKNVIVYHYGTSAKKVLLVHGWSGRGTQLFKIADALLKNGYSTISFDAPAHGKSDGKTSIMTEFIAVIHEIDSQYGPFEAAVGHSLGGMSLLNAVKTNLQIKSLVVIGSGDVVEDIIDDFIIKLELPYKFGAKLRAHFERISGEAMDEYSAYHAAAKTEIPTLVIHDQDDIEVPVSSGKHIYKHLKNGELMITAGLGHRKILGNEDVISRTIKFINDEKYEIYTDNARNFCDDIV